MDYPRELLERLYRTMVRIRYCEESLVEPILKGEIRRYAHRVIFIVVKRPLRLVSVPPFRKTIISSATIVLTAIIWRRGDPFKR